MPAASHESSHPGTSSIPTAAADERAASLRTRRRRRVNQFRVCASGLPGLAGNKLNLIGDPLPGSGLGELVSPHQRR